MTKSEFVAKLAETAQISKKQAGVVFATFVDTIAASLKSGDRIALPGLGSFSSVQRQARKAVKFSTSSALSKNLNGAKKAPAKAAAKKAPAKAAKKKK